MLQLKIYSNLLTTHTIDINTILKAVQFSTILTINYMEIIYSKEDINMINHVQGKLCTDALIFILIIDNNCMGYFTWKVLA